VRYQYFNCHRAICAISSRVHDQHYYTTDDDTFFRYTLPWYNDMYILSFYPGIFLKHKTLHFSSVFQSFFYSRQVIQLTMTHLVTTHCDAYLHHLRCLIHLMIDEISRTQYTRETIPCGYTGHKFNFLKTKTFDDLWGKDAAYLKSLYAKHHDLYTYECDMIDKLAYLRQLYENIHSALWVQEMVASARACGILPHKDTTTPLYIENNSDRDDNALFGETYDWIS
jgi:hypothetical protein